MQDDESIEIEDRNHRYRVRRGLFGVSVLQELKPVYGTEYGKLYVVDHYEWKDVPYFRAPRALTTTIKG